MMQVRLQQAETQLASHRLAAAAATVQGLQELGGSWVTLQGKPLHEWQEVLEQQLTQLEWLVRRPLAVAATPEQRFQRAEILIQLHRLDEAAQLLQPLSQGSVLATLLLAVVERERRRWLASDQAYQRALDFLARHLDDHPDYRLFARQAIEGLVHNAREDRRPQDCVGVLQRGLELLPEERSYFHYLLARHYIDAGQPGRAWQHLHDAATAAPNQLSQQRLELQRRLLQSTPICLLHSPRPPFLKELADGGADK
ncbi:MAG: hypothetical protein NZU63_09530 [Gemmataceae bacterium]|nr:hypothetical protein [Gemmataceae bacterium]MDW8244420.1 hypothetical protein [Thermogemmata sp.]